MACTTYFVHVKGPLMVGYAQEVYVIKFGLYSVDSSAPAYKQVHRG